MNIQSIKNSITRRSLLLLVAAGFACTAVAQENSITFGLGNAQLKGDIARGQNMLHVEDRMNAGIEELFFTKAINDNTTFTLEAKAFDFDYLIDLKLVKEGVGYIHAGYKQTRYWYDGSGAFYLPRGSMIKLYPEELYLDRGNLWLELGRTLSEHTNFVLRYDLYTREGKKDSLSMGEVTVPVTATSLAGARGIIPAFRQIDERRHVAKATVTTGNDKATYKFSGMIDSGEMNNSLNVRRRYLETAAPRNPDRLFTHKDKSEFDIYSFYAAAQNKINERMTLNAAISRTTIDNVLHGTRIYGLPASYDPVFDAAYANRQQRDEGFKSIHGDVQSTQHVGTVNFVVRPNKDWTMLAVVRLERFTTKADAEYAETNNPSTTGNATLLLITEEIGVHTAKKQNNSTESFEVRYNGIKNVALNAKAEFEQTSGKIEELQIVEPGILNTIRIQRNGDFDVNGHKYSFTANWYPRAGTTIAAQVYNKVRKHGYGVTIDNTPNTSGNRYPGYPTDFDTEVNDMNVRLSWRVAHNLRLVTRYDYMETTNDFGAEGAGFGQASKLESQIISQTITWNPTARLFIQGNVNVVRDNIKTPFTNLTGNAAGITSDTHNDYTNVSVNAGYALDDQSDLLIVASQYRATNYMPTDFRSMSYGTDAKTQQASATYTRSLNARTKLSLKYTYAKHEEPSSGGFSDYDAHLIYGKLQYRF